MDYTVHGILQARILECVDFPFSRGSSQPRDQTWISLTAGRFFTSWATREAQVVKNLHANTRDTRDARFDRGWVRSPGRGHGNPLQYYCLENLMGKRAWWATVLRGLTNSWTRFSDWALECASWSIVTESRLVVVKRASLVAQLMKNPPTMQETPVPFLVRKIPCRKGKATHSSILAWRIPRAV